MTQTAAAGATGGGIARGGSEAAICGSDPGDATRVVQRMPPLVAASSLGPGVSAGRTSGSNGEWEGDADRGIGDGDDDGGGGPVAAAQASAGERRHRRKGGGRPVGRHVAATAAADGLRNGEVIAKDAAAALAAPPHQPLVSTVHSHVPAGVTLSKPRPVTERGWLAADGRTAAASAGGTATTFVMVTPPMHFGPAVGSVDRGGEGGNKGSVRGKTSADAAAADGRHTNRTGSDGGVRVAGRPGGIPSRHSWLPAACSGGGRGSDGGDEAGDGGGVSDLRSTAPTLASGGRAEPAGDAAAVVSVVAVQGHGEVAIVPISAAETRCNGASVAAAAALVAAQRASWGSVAAPTRDPGGRLQHSELPPRLPSPRQLCPSPLTVNAAQTVLLRPRSSPPSRTSSRRGPTRKQSFRRRRRGRRAVRGSDIGVTAQQPRRAHTDRSVGPGFVPLSPRTLPASSLPMWCSPPAPRVLRQLASL